MIKCCDDQLPAHQRAELDKRALRLTLVDTRYEDGLVGYTMTYLNLKQAVGLRILRELPDAHRRQREALEETRQKRASNAVAGGVVGAVLDGSMGDDSVLDGALIGAVIGATMTEPVAIDLTEQREHYAVLAFKDGSAFTLVVDAKGIADLLGVVHHARSQNESMLCEPALAARALTATEQRLARQAAKNRYISDQQRLSQILAFAALLCLGFGVLLIGLNQTSNWMSWLASNLPQGAPADEQPIMTNGVTMWLAAAAIFGLLMAASFPYESNRIRRGWAAGEGRPEKVRADD